MKYLASCILLAVSLHGLAHEGHQAFYRLFLENGTLTLEAKLEIPDLKTAVEKEKFCTEDQDFNFCAGMWLIDQISISIDGKIHALTLETSATEEGHLFLTYSLGNLPADFKQIDVKNTAFISAFGHYENVFEIEVNNNKRGYKLTETRTSISHVANPNQ
jgi:hypothetical protein